MKQVVIVVLTLEDQTFATPLYFFIFMSQAGFETGSVEDASWFNHIVDDT